MKLYSAASLHLCWVGYQGGLACVAQAADYFCVEPWPCSIWKKHLRCRCTGILSNFVGQAVKAADKDSKDVPAATSEVRSRTCAWEALTKA